MGSAEKIQRVSNGIREANGNIMRKHTISQGTTDIFTVIHWSHSSSKVNKIQ